MDVVLSSNQEDSSRPRDYRLYLCRDARGVSGQTGTGHDDSRDAGEYLFGPSSLFHFYALLVN